MPDNPAFRVAVLDDFQNVASTLADWRSLEPRAETNFYHDHVTGEALLQRLLPFDVIMLIRERTKLPAQLIAQLPNLKLVVTAGMRNLGIDMAACHARGIHVCGTDTGSSSTAELAFGMLLALSRHLVAEDSALREGRWQTRMGYAVKGLTLGVLGLGRLGSQMAGYGRAFGMNVIAWSQNLTEAQAVAGGAEKVDKSELFRRSDFISLHVVLSERTRRIVGAAELAQMKPSACLINTARSGLVDENALIDALERRQIAGAALDVFDTEPLPHDAAILSAPNTLLTPHIGYASRDSYRIYFTQAVEDIAAWLDGKPIRIVPA